MAANNEYVNRVDLGNETIIDLTNDTATESDVLAGQTFHLRSGAPGTGTLNAVTEIQPGDNLGQIKASQLVGNDYNVDLPGFGTAYGLDIYDDTLPIQFTHPGGAIADGIVYGNDNVGKNLLEITRDTTTISGVTLTVDKIAGTITANGTATGTVSFGLDIDTQSYYGNFYVSISTDGGSDTTYFGYCYDTVTGQRCKKWDDVTASENIIGNGSEQVRIEQGHRTRIFLQISRNYVCDNIVFKPMLRLPDTTAVFEPYQVGVGERTKNLFDGNGEFDWGYLDNNGRLQAVESHKYATYGYIPLETERTYTYLAFSEQTTDPTLRTIRLGLYDSNKNFLSRTFELNTGLTPRTVTLDANVAYIRMSVDINLQDFDLVEGSTAPVSYIPYGYQIPLDLRQRSYNELDIRDYAATYFGVRWYEQDGILYANGTYNDNAAHSWPRLYLQLGSGAYVVSGSTDYQSTGIRVQIGTCDDAQGTNFASLGYDTGSGFTFTLTSASWISVRMYTKADLYQQSIDLEFPLMIRKVDTPSVFRPYMWYYDHDEGYIGETPLTAGQSRSFYDMGIDLTAQPGTSYIDTTLYNKPRVEMVPYGGILTVIERLRETEASVKNKQKKNVVLYDAGPENAGSKEVTNLGDLAGYSYLIVEVFTYLGNNYAVGYHTSINVSLALLEARDEAGCLSEMFILHVVDGNSTLSRYTGLVSVNGYGYTNSSVSIWYCNPDNFIDVGYFPQDLDNIYIKRVIGIPK